MNQKQSSRPVKALGLCSGGLDSILSALVLKQQGIQVTWISFTTPFFSASAAKQAAAQTDIPLEIVDITDAYMEMIRSPKAGFGKNMNPCMDCHALMFKIAGRYLDEHGFDFLFSGEVLGQRPKSQVKNALRYVEKNSGYDGRVLRPLSAKLLPETQVERSGLVDREKLLDISGRSRKIQMAMAEKFGITDYPSPAGGCLLTDKLFSSRLKDLLFVQKDYDRSQLFLLKSGRHFRLDDKTKVIVGRSKQDNKFVLKHADKTCHILIKHAWLPGPDVVMTGSISEKNIETAAGICAAYTKAEPGKPTQVNVSIHGNEQTITVVKQTADTFRDLMI